MKRKIHQIPAIRIESFYEDITDFYIYHLYLNDKFEGCYFKVGDIEERLKLLLQTELHLIAMGG